MKLIYTTQTAGFKDGFSYRNPRYFAGVERDAEQIFVVGTWPNVVAAYELAGIEVQADEGSQLGVHDRSVPSRAGLDEALSHLPDGHTDPDYVVRAMRSHFGDLFTDDDEVLVRDVVKAPADKLSDGLKVDEIKAALAEKGIEIPEGVTLKADLAALLDNAEA